MPMQTGLGLRPPLLHLLTGGPSLTLPVRLLSQSQRFLPPLLVGNAGHLAPSHKKHKEIACGPGSDPALDEWQSLLGP